MSSSSPPSGKVGVIGLVDTRGATGVREVAGAKKGAEGKRGEGRAYK